MTLHKQNPETPIMSDKSDNISDKPLHDDEISYCHPGNMSTRYVQPASIGAPKWAVDIQHHYRQALRDDITARYENTLRSLDDGWRPIESAPQDWVDVLLFSPDHKGFDNGGVFSGFCTGKGGDWLVYDFTRSDGATPVTPTHWRPLPAPPQDKRAAALSDLAALDGETM